jgi:hypothetical protein
MSEQGDEIRFPAPELIKVQLGDVICRFIWNKIRYRPQTEHLHEFIFNGLLWTLGEKWHKHQISKSAEERHIIMRWANARYEFLTHARSLGLTTKDRVIPSGEVRELLSLAADVYYLQLVNELPRDLVERLKSYDGFQGARYEIAVAASLVRVGFEIKWKRVPKGEKHYEFDAIHKYTNEEVAIEVKSRHREGTLNQKGAMPDFSAIKADIFGKYNEAMEQNPRDKPFGVYIDINLPHESDVPIPSRQWISDLLKKVESQRGAIFGPTSPNFLVVTNSAWHYEGESRAEAGEFMIVMPRNPPHPLKNPVTMEAIGRSLNTFSAIPDED